MAKALQICRICLNVNVKMFTLQNTNMENLYTLLTQVYVDIEDGKPTTVCFLCYARLRQCIRLQQQAVKSNELLEQLLGGGIMHGTTDALLNNQYNSQDLQVSSTYYLDLEPANCEDVLLDPKVKADSLISVKEEVEKAIDEGHNVTDFSEDAKHCYVLDPESIHSDPEDDQLLIEICSNKSAEVNNIAHGTKWRKRQKEENLCSIQQEKEIQNDSQLSHSIQILQKDKNCNENEKAKSIYVKSERKLKKTIINVESNEQKIKKPSHNEDTQKQCVDSPKTPVINTIINEFQCNECGKQFSTKDILTHHILKCMQTTENIVSDNQLTIADNLKSLLSEIYSCDICTFETNQKRSIETHLKMHNVNKVLSCKICEYRCTYKSYLKRHMKKHTDEKPFSCSICEYRSAHKYTLKTHMRNHIGEKSFSCNICKYRCAQKGQLKIHMIKHTGEKPFSCNICEYICAQKNVLKTHMFKHTGEKPFSCNICEYRCANKRFLKKHMVKHTGEKPFSCEICEYKCAEKYQLKKHIITHTDEKPVCCNICQYKCAHKCVLKIHMLTHTGEKPFSCNICGYRCARKEDLKKHIRYHTGEKPFSCNHCEYRCAQKGNLNRHMRKHTD